MEGNPWDSVILRLDFGEERGDKADLLVTV